MDYSGTVTSGVRVAQLVGITTSAWLSGSIASFSFVGVQAALNAKTPTGDAAKLWHEMYVIGASVAPFVAIIPATCFGYLAYDANASALRLGDFKSTAFYLYSFASIIIPAIAPFTMTVMSPTNKTLHGKAEAADASKEHDQEVYDLFGTWYRLNLVRSVMVGGGCLAGAYAAFGGI